jgi:hypothetical protein
MIEVLRLECVYNSRFHHLHPPRTIPLQCDHHLTHMYALKNSFKQQHIF